MVYRHKDINRMIPIFRSKVLDLYGLKMVAARSWAVHWACLQRSDIIMITHGAYLASVQIVRPFSYVGTSFVFLGWGRGKWSALKVTLVNTLVTSEPMCRRCATRTHDRCRRRGFRSISDMIIMMLAVISNWYDWRITSSTLFGRKPGWYILDVLAWRQKRVVLVL